MTKAAPTTPSTTAAATPPENDALRANEVREVIIIGSGPAGYTAAVYAARANLKPVVFEGAVTAGGALMNTTEVENFPGFPAGIMGPDLMEAMRAQAMRFGAQMVRDDVTAMSLTGPVKAVTDGEGTSRGGSHLLDKFATSVTIAVRRDELRASKIMADRAMADPKIRFAWNSAVEAIHGQDKVTGVTLRDTVTGATRLMAATGVFVAIGHDPRNELIKGVIDLDASGYVTVQPGCTATNIAGVFAAGDLVDHTYRQAITAAGTGCAAALDAEHHLRDLAPRCPQDSEI